MQEPDERIPRWRENLIAVLLFLVLLGLIIFSVQPAPFIYGGF